MGRFDNYLFRCSALGPIMSKEPGITKGTATYLQELFIGEIYGIKKEISSKYFDKGNYMEQDGITLLNKALYPNKLLVKNKERRNNEFIHGECDCLAPDEIVYDIKNAYDLFTFGKATLTHDYKWQLKGYQWLWPTIKGRLFYCLNNTPEHLLQDEEKKLFYQGRYATFENPDFKEACDKLRAAHIFDHMELWERFKVFNVELSDADIKLMKDKVLACRNYLNKLDKERDEMLHYNVSLMNGGGLIAEHDSGVNATIVKPL